MITIEDQQLRMQTHATNRQDAIRKVGQLLVTSGCIEAGYITSMLGREQVANTYLGNGIAIPHGLPEDRDLIKRTGIAVVQVPAGVTWNPGETAQLIVGIAAKSAIFEQFFTQKSIDDQFVRIPGRTRIGVKIVDEANQQTTDINMPGLAPTEEAMNALFKVIERLTASCDWFVISGTLPPGVPETTYATLITQLKRHGKQVVLDTSRDALREGVLAGPTIVKPNVDELQQLTGRTLTDEVALGQAARQLLDGGIQLVVISMGERGAMFVDPATTLIAVPPSVSVKSTVGAGDAMVAGLITGKVRGLSLADCARLATAFSLGAITSAGHNLPASGAIQAYFQQVSVHLLAGVPRSVSL